LPLRAGCGADPVVVAVAWGKVVAGGKVVVGG
jgi:hypothetical protein